MRETLVQSLGWEDLLEKEMATHSSILVWKIPWTVEPGRLHTVHGVAKSRTRLSNITSLAATAAKSLQSCPTLCDPIDSSPPGSPIPGILQARTLEWVAISFSNTFNVIMDSNYIPFLKVYTRYFRLFMNILTVLFTLISIRKNTTGI